MMTEKALKADFKDQKNNVGSFLLRVSEE